MRGLPAPTSKSRVTLDADSHLSQLDQDGWRVEYANYRLQHGYWLPERLKLFGQNIDITLVIKEWQPRRLGL
ncbi:Outer-membrane lipoprotein LolB precursor [compost metagenome]